MAETNNFFEESNGMAVGILGDPRTRYIALTALGLLIAIAQVLLGNMISIAKVSPDFVLVFCVWLSIVEGQIIGMSSGFVMGCIYDIVTGDILGTNALAKTIASFIAGYFHNTNLTRITLTTMRFVVMVTLCSVVHNFIYFFFYIRPTEISFWAFFLQYGVGTTLYTALVALVPVLMRSRRD